jgi:integrase
MLSNSIDALSYLVFWGMLHAYKQWGKTMAVSKRDGSKYNYIQFQYDGRTYIKPSKTTDKLLAEKLESQWRMQLIEQHQLGIKAPIEISKAFQLYSNSKTDIRTHKRTVSYCNDAVKYWAHLTYIHQIQTKEIENYKNDLHARGLMNASIKHKLRPVGATIKYAKKLGYQVADIEMPRVKVTKGRLRYLTHDEERRLLIEVNPYRETKWLAKYENRHTELLRQMHDFHDIVILLLDTGARQGEICLLEWEKINLDKREIILWRPKVRNESVLYMTDRVYEVLQRRHQSKTTQFVFNNKSGYARKTIANTFRNAYRRAGIEGCTAHTLRHTHATRLIQNGMSIYEIKEILGHTDIETTMRYAHIEQAQVSLKARDVINKLNVQQIANVQLSL